MEEILHHLDDAYRIIHLDDAYRIICTYNCVLFFSMVSKCRISSTNANTFIFMDNLILKVSFHESSSSLPIALAAWYIGTQCLDGRTTQEKSWQRRQKWNPKQPFFPQSCRIMRSLISQQRGHVSQGDFRNALSEGHTYVRVELAQGKWTFARTSASITVFHSMLLVNRCSISASMRGWQGWQPRVLVETVRSSSVGG